jgi:Uma2 family endonuclease
VSVAATRAISTDADLLRLPKDGRKYELVDGEIVMSPAGLRHEQIVARLIARLWGFVSPRGLGEVFGSSAGYRLPGGNVRSPDVSFVAAGRLPEGPAPSGFGELAPDLAVEVLSPGDDSRTVLDKVGEYLRAGVRVVWVIDPDARRAAIYRSLTDVHEVGPADPLQAGDLLPGFSCPLGDLLG